MLNKMNTFLDFIACAEHLIQENYTNWYWFSSWADKHGGRIFINLLSIDK